MSKNRKNGEVTMKKKANKRYQDSVFVDLFGREEYAVELVNALCGTVYQKEDIMNVTLKQLLFCERYNDLAFLTKDNRLIVLIEHQATINPNMPVRMLLYIAEEYNKFLRGEFGNESYNVYGRKIVKLPTPEFFVIYTGEEERPAVEILRLSDSFSIKAPIEVEVTCYNINKELEIKEKSSSLSGYSALIQEIKGFKKQGYDLAQAIQKAVEVCMEHGVLTEYLIRHESEVSNMLFEEYTVEDIRRMSMKAAAEEGWEKGLAKGLEEGLEKGLEKGLEQGLEKGLEQGLEKGLEQGREEEFHLTETVFKMLKEGKDEETIASSCGIDRKEVERIMELAKILAN